MQGREHVVAHVCTHMYVRMLAAQDRRVWVLDSFAGLPKPVPELWPADKGDERQGEL